MGHPVVNSTFNQHAEYYVAVISITINPHCPLSGGDVFGREGGERRGRMARPSLLREAPGRLRGGRLRVKRVENRK